MLILDEPTNHLDVDAREALSQALNAYTGAVVIVSHDRHMLEMTADRLILVHDGTAQEFDGSIDDYIGFVLAETRRRRPGATRSTRRRPADLPLRSGRKARSCAGAPRNPRRG